MKKKSLGVTGESHTATSKCPGVNKAASPNEAVIFVWHTAALLPYRAPSQLPIAVPTAVGPKRVETVERGGGDKSRKKLAILVWHQQHVRSSPGRRWDWGSNRAAAFATRAQHGVILVPRVLERALTTRRSTDVVRLVAIHVCSSSMSIVKLRAGGAAENTTALHR